MASTGGGFLIGFGLCLLLICGGAYAFLQSYYGQVVAWKSRVDQIYYITHSPMYVSAMESLETIAPYADQIADALNNPLIAWMNLGWLGDYIRGIGGAASLMREAYMASEEAYHAIHMVSLAPQYLIYGGLFGLLLIVIGIVLVVKAKRANWKSPC